MIKKLSLIFLVVFACTFSTMQAQKIYDLYEMTDDEFKNGGNSVWSFERYDKTTGIYAPFTIYGDSGRINQFDHYNPYRFGGELKGDPNPEHTSGHQAYGYSPLMYGLYSTKAEYVYIGDKARKFETQSTAKASAVFVFTVPEEGYYRLDMAAQCQDSETKSLKPYPMLVNRYRYSSSSNINYADSRADMGMNVSYAQDGVSVAMGEPHPVTGEIMSTERRWYTPFEAENYFLCFNGKAGDKITIELNVDGSAAWDGCWVRTRFHALKATKVTESEAKNSGRYVGAYDPVDLSKVNEIYNRALDLIDQANVGTGKGDYPENAFTKFDQVITEFESVKDILNAMSVTTWEYRLEEAIAEFQSHKILIVWSEHYRLLPINNVDPVEQQQQENWFAEQSVTENLNDIRWKFFSYANASGLYSKIANYGTITNYTSANGWSDDATWFYIAKDGSIHPALSKQPAIIFTAPQSGYYKVYEKIKRISDKQSYTLYMRNRYIAANVDINNMTVPKESFIMHKGYGNNSALPADTIFYVKLNAGDRITFEQDCYTANKNSSANSQWLELAIVDLQKEYQTEAEILAAITEDTGKVLINPFEAGDFTQLSELITEYKQFLTTIVVGDGIGEYSELEYATFLAIIENAENTVTEGTASDYEIIAKVAELENAYKTFLSKTNSEMNTIVEGEYFFTVNDLYINNPGIAVIGNGKGPQVSSNGLLENVNIESANQIFKLSKVTLSDETQRYSIYSTLNEAEEGETPIFRHLTENSIYQSVWGSSDNDWRTVNIHYNGTKYAIQNAGSSANKGYWGYDEINQKTVVSMTDPKFVFKFIAVKDIFAEEVSKGRTYFNAATVGTGDKEYSQEVYDAFKTALESAETIISAGTAASQNLFDYAAALKLFVTNDGSGSSINNPEANQSDLVLFGGYNSFIIANAEVGSQMRVYNLYGQLVKSEKIESSYQNIDIASGIYIIKISESKGAKTSKVIVR